MKNLFRDFQPLQQYLLPYFILVVVHLIIGLWISFPSVIPDEFSFMITARYLSGAGILPDLEGQLVRPLGYPSLIAPLYWLFSDPLSFYKAATTLNAFIVSTLYIPIFFLLNRILKYSVSASIVIALTTSLYPTFALYSGLVLSENLFFPLYALLPIIFWLFYSKRSTFYAILFGLLVPLLYAAHGRAFPVVIISLLHIAVLAFFRLVPRIKCLVSAALICIGYEAIHLANTHFATVSRAVDHSVYKLLARLLTFEGWKSFVIEIFGQTWYLIVATYGLFVVGFYFCVKLILKHGERTLMGSLRNPTSHAILFLLTTSFGMFFTSSLHLAGSHLIVPEWVGLIYGRYNEGFLALYIALGLVGLYPNTEMSLDKWTSTTVVSLALLVTTFVLFVSHGTETFSYFDNAGTAVLGLGPWFKHSFALGVLAVLGIWLIFVMSMKWKFYAGVIVVILFLSVSTFSSYNRIVSVGKYMEQYFASIASHLVKFGDNSMRISYNMDAPYQYPSGTSLTTGLLYLLPKTKVHRFHSKNDERPDHPVVISSKNWPAAKKLGAKLLAVERTANRAIWYIPGEGDEKD